MALLVPNDGLLRFSLLKKFINQNETFTIGDKSCRLMFWLQLEPISWNLTGKNTSEFYEQKVFLLDKFHRIRSWRKLNKGGKSESLSPFLKQVAAWFLSPDSRDKTANLDHSSASGGARWAPIRANWSDFSCWPEIRTSSTTAGAGESRCYRFYSNFGSITTCQVLQQKGIKVIEIKPKIWFN